MRNFRILIMTILSAGLLVVLTFLTIQQNTFAVPAADTYTVCASGCDFTSVQTAINAAADGDTIDLGGEAFTETLVIDKSIHIEGEGIKNTIIQAAAAPGIATSRVITVANNVTVTVNKVTIRYGVTQGTNPVVFDAFGGGIFSHGNLTLSNSAVISNTATGMGGGLYCYIGDITLSNVIFAGNRAETSGGGAMTGCAWPKLSNVVFLFNTAGDHGGGMYAQYAPTLNNVTFIHNSATMRGGGIYLLSSFGNYSNLVFKFNTAMDGGGMYLLNSNINFSDSVFYGNIASQYGGGIYADGDESWFENLLIVGNSATTYSGGGIYNTFGSNSTLTNATIAGNSAGNTAGGISNNASSPDLTNVIVWGNAGGSYQLSNNPTSSPTVQYSIIEGCGDSNNWDTLCGTDQGNNIDVDPLFARDPDSGDGDWTTLIDNDYGDLHLQSSSPGINTGTNTNCPDRDLDGLVRPQGSRCEIGAYEFGGSSTCVVGNVVNANYSTIQAAVNDNACEVIHILPGTYHENVDLNRSVSLLGTGDQGVIVEGDQQDFVVGISPGVTATLKNLYIFNGAGCIVNSGNLILEDSTLEYCNSNFAGGGIRNLGNLQAENVIIQWNYAPEGAGIYNHNGSSASIIDSHIINNSSSTQGGGISAVFADHLLIENSWIYNNVADFGNGNSGGGGLFLSYLNECTILDSIIENNSATGNGGGILAEACDILTIENSEIIGNRSKNDGGGLSIVGSVDLIHNTIRGNYSDTYGGGLDFGGPHTAQILATTIQLNSAPNGGGIYTGDYGYQTNIVDSVILSNTSSNTGGGILISPHASTAMTVTNSILEGNSATNSGGAIAKEDDIGNLSVLIRYSQLINNNAAKGGGIYIKGNQFDDIDLTIRYSTIRDNLGSSQSGGGIYFEGGNQNQSFLKLNNSTINNNESLKDGGGVAMAGGTFTSTNSTYSGNIARNHGGGIVITKTLVNNEVAFTNVTITENKADNNGDNIGDGGGIYREIGSGTVHFTNSIIADNLDQSPGGINADDCFGDFNSAKFNFIGTVESCTGWTSFDIRSYTTSLDPMLLPLADNGGPTWTHEPDPASSVVDGVDSSYTDVCPNKDQRGVLRPKPNNNSNCDIGAFELGTCQDPVTTTLTIDRDGNNILLNWTNNNKNREFVLYRVNDYVQMTDLVSYTLHVSSYTDYNAIGDISNNYVYRVVGENACGERSALSNKVGEFDYRLDTDEITTTRTLHYSLIGIPLEGPTIPTTAEEVASYIDPNENVKAVARWNPLTNSWVVHRIGSVHYGTPDFDVFPGDVLLIAMDQNGPESFAWIGDIPANNAIHNTITPSVANFLMVPLSQSGKFTMTADGLATDIGDVSHVAVWSTLQQRWFIREVSGVGFNFTVYPGYAYGIFAGPSTPTQWP